MTDIYDAYSEINSLDALMFIGGDEQTLTFFIVDETGNPIDLTLGTSYWLLAPYGNPEMPVLELTGTPGSEINEVSFLVESDDTADLSGKYIQQLLVIDFLGSEYRPCQGIVTIIPQITRL